jgi:hypothetical protein
MKRLRTVIGRRHRFCGLTEFLYQRYRDYCKGGLQSRWGAMGLMVPLGKR